MSLFSLEACYSVPLSKLEGIEGELWSLHGSQEHERPVGDFQGSEQVFRVLEDLQEAIFDYQVRPWH